MATSREIKNKQVITNNNCDCPDCLTAQKLGFEICSRCFAESSDLANEVEGISLTSENPTITKFGFQGDDNAKP